MGRVSKFGLEPRHHVLLEGCTFPPEIQSSMAQTLGMMTVCIRLALANTSSKFTKKYEEALKRGFKPHHTIANRIGKALIDAPLSAAPQLIGKLGDLALLVPPRNQRRMFPPLHALAFFCLCEEEIRALFTSPVSVSGGASQEDIIMDIGHDDDDDDDIAVPPRRSIADSPTVKSGNAYEFDCSGKGALKCWTHVYGSSFSHDAWTRRGRRQAG